MNSLLLQIDQRDSTNRTQLTTQSWTWLLLVRSMMRCTPVILSHYTTHGTCYACSVNFCKTRVEIVFSCHLLHRDVVCPHAFHHHPVRPHQYPCPPPFPLLILSPEHRPVRVPSLARPVRRVLVPHPLVILSPRRGPPAAPAARPGRQRGLAGAPQ